MIALTRRLFILAFALAVVSAGPAAAQYPFGKNKVSYTSKDWKVLQTDHVDIYYYPSERNLVSFAAPIVEETYLEFEELFGIEFRNRMPLVFYSSHYDFQQTNIIPSFISESTGGFTDLIKGRIAIPFTGSLWQFRHVIRHEMVHAFMLEKLAQVMQGHHRFTYTHPPLWFVEGMAEYFASPKADTQHNMFIRDGLMHNRLPDLINIWRIQGTYLMYKEGEAVVRYIADNFGVEAVVQILDNWWKADRFEFVLKQTINMDLVQLNDAFMRSIKRRHYPAIMKATFAADVGKQLTAPHTFHARPTVGTGPDGKPAIFAHWAHDGVITLARLQRDENGRLAHEVLVESGRSGSFESLPATRSKLETRGDTLIFVAKRKARDAIYLYDTRRDRIFDHFTFPDLTVIFSPTLSPAGDQIVFSAIDTTGTMDLYLYDMRERYVARLTNDPYSELDPDFHPFENRVVFGSDRCESQERQYQGIYEIDVVTGVVKALTCGHHVDGHPDWAPDGRSFLFSSDRDGTFNIYSFDYDGELITRQTSVLGGVTNPASLPDQTGFIASGYYQSEFHIFKFPMKRDGVAASAQVAQVQSSALGWTKQDPKHFNYKTSDYKTKLGIDFAGAGVAIDPDFGSVGNGAELVLSDLLGNLRYHIFFGSASSTDTNFLKRLNVGVNYVNISHRVNYSLGIFHLTSTFGDVFSTVRTERRYGAAAGLSFPFSKFSRVDATLVMRFVERLSTFSSVGGGETIVYEDLPKSFIGSTFLTYVKDNTLWTIGGPLKGWRYYTTVGHTYDFQDRGFDYSTLQFDLRKYFRISRRIVLAERFVTRHTWGGDFQTYFLGGPWDFRGYDVREFEGRSTYLINSELRFPLIDHFSLALPFGAVDFPRFRGSLFFDAGRVSRYVFDTDWLGSFGAGVELNLGYAPVFRVNFTRQTDFATISPDTGFELFIGYNY